MSPYINLSFFVPSWGTPREAVRRRESIGAGIKYHTRKNTAQHSNIANFIPTWHKQHTRKNTAQRPKIANFIPSLHTQHTRENTAQRLQTANFVPTLCTRRVEKTIALRPKTANFIPSLHTQHTRENTAHRPKISNCTQLAHKTNEITTRKPSDNNDAVLDDQQLTSQKIHPKRPPPNPIEPFCLAGINQL